VARRDAKNAFGPFERALSQRAAGPKRSAGRGISDARPDAIMVIHGVLVPVDFDETSDRALEVATDLAQRFGASITIFHVVDVPTYAYANFGAALPPPEMLGALESHARGALDQRLRKVRPIVPTCKAVVTTGVPWRQILAAIAEPGIDLVVLGTQRRRWLEHALLGSVAEKIVRMSPVPVLTVPPAPAAAR
jgi:nucleotide-binding universal stress UspA family protein